jgi:hypothetical protein
VRLAVGELRKLVPLPVTFARSPEAHPLGVGLHGTGHLKVRDFTLVLSEEVSDEVDVKRGVVSYEVMALDDLSEERSDLRKGRAVLDHLRRDPVLLSGLLAHLTVRLEKSGEYRPARCVDDRDLADLRVWVLAQDPGRLCVNDECERIRESLLTPLLRAFLRLKDLLLRRLFLL